MKQISWNDFEKIDIRVGTIVGAVVFAKAKKPAYKLVIDFGPDIGLKNSSAQITFLYAVDVLPGMQIIAIVNFPPKNIAGFISECLVLGIYAQDGVVILSPQRPVVNGLKIG